MSTNRLVLRRITTVIGVVAVMALGFGSIRAASAWTAASAPLSVAPVSVANLQADLADEHARSQALTEQLHELDARSLELESALSQANDRIASDTTHATELEQRLADASAKLGKLETAIAKAKKRLAAQAAAATAAAHVTRTSSGSTASSSHHDDEHEDEDDDGDHSD